MLNIETIEKEILELEQHDTTYATCEKLAWLYTVRDHLRGFPVENVRTRRQSEFCNACVNRPIQDIMDILDEHMDAVHILYPREYNLVIAKINELSPR